MASEPASYEAIYRIVRNAVSAMNRTRAGKGWYIEKIRLPQWAIDISEEIIGSRGIVMVREIGFSSEAILSGLRASPFSKSIQEKADRLITRLFGIPQEIIVGALMAAFMQTWSTTGNSGGYYLRDGSLDTLCTRVTNELATKVFPSARWMVRDDVLRLIFPVCKRGRASDQDLAPLISRVLMDEYGNLPEEQPAMVAVI